MFGPSTRRYQCAKPLGDTHGFEFGEFQATLGEFPIARNVADRPDFRTSAVLRIIDDVYLRSSLILRPLKSDNLSHEIFDNTSQIDQCISEGLYRGVQGVRRVKDPIRDMLSGSSVVRVNAKRGKVDVSKLF